jgi:adenylate kinase
VILLLMGAKGSGKGTQGRLLSEHFGVPYLASGDLLRRAISQDSALGRQVREYVERGLYVPDGLMVPAAMAALEALRHQSGTPGVVLDGFPRTREQAVAVDEALAKIGTRIQRVLFLYVPKEVLVARVAGRWTCSNCGATYNVTSKPPRVAGTCDRCGQPLIQRVDDRPEQVERRLGVDLEQTIPLAAHYHQKGVLVQVDGNRPPEQVTADLIAAVGDPDWRCKEGER